MKSQLKVSRLIVIALVPVVVFFFWAPKGLGKLADTDISPKGFYRVEYWWPSAFAIFDSLRFEMPMFLRVYDQRTAKLMHESDIIEMQGRGQILWPTEKYPEIDIGMVVSVPATPEPID